MLPQHTVFCISSARTVREIDSLLHAAVRVRWVSEVGALPRMIAAHDSVAACIVDSCATLLPTLTLIRQLAPAARRLALVDGCDLHNVRELLESGLAQELIYRPIDGPLLLSSIGIAPPRSVVTAAARRPTVLPA